MTAVERSTVARMDRFAIEAGAAALSRTEKFLGYRIIDDARDSTPAFGNGHGNREMRLLLEEGRGTVDRIDDELALRACSRGISPGFFRQPAIIQPRRFQSPAQEMIDSQVRLGHGFAAAFAPAAIWLTVVTTCNFAGPAHRLFDQRKIQGVIRPQRSCPRRVTLARLCHSGK